MGGMNYMCRWTEHSTHFFSSITSLRNTETLTDVLITCADKQFRAHKLVLCASSEYFRRIFSENSEKSAMAFVHMMGVPAIYIQNILQYLYTGQIEITPSDVEPFLRLANELKISGLHKQESRSEDEDCNLKVEQSLNNGEHPDLRVPFPPTTSEMSSNPHHQTPPYLAGGQQPPLLGAGGFQHSSAAESAAAVAAAAAGMRVPLQMQLQSLHQSALSAAVALAAAAAAGKQHERPGGGGGVGSAGVSEDGGDSRDGRRDDCLEGEEEQITIMPDIADMTDNYESIKDENNYGVEEGGVEEPAADERISRAGNRTDFQPDYKISVNSLAVDPAGASSSKRKHSDDERCVDKRGKNDQTFVKNDDGAEYAFAPAVPKAAAAVLAAAAAAKSRTLACSPTMPSVSISPVLPASTTVTPVVKPAASTNGSPATPIAATAAKLSASSTPSNSPQSSGLFSIPGLTPLHCKKGNSGLHCNHAIVSMADGRKVHYNKLKYEQLMGKT